MGEIWVEAGEFFGQFPDRYDEEKAIEDDDYADGREETPNEIILEREPTAGTHSEHEIIPESWNINKI